MTLGAHPKAETDAYVEAAPPPGTPSPVRSRKPVSSDAELASRPAVQLTIDAFPEWLGELPVPFNQIPF